MDQSVPFSCYVALGMYHFIKLFLSDSYILYEHMNQGGHFAFGCIPK